MIGANGWGIFFLPSMSWLGHSFDVLGDSLKDVSDPLRRAVEEVMIPSFQTNFDVGGRPSWAAYDEDTKNPGDQMLVRTGAMEAGATSLSIWDISETEAAVTRAPTDYARFHQYGTSKMTARPFIVMQPEDEDAIEELFGDWVGEQISTSGVL